MTSTLPAATPPAKRAALSNYHLVAVVWDDAWGNDGQMTLHEIESRQAHPERFTTFGLRIKEAEEGIVIASEVEENGAFRHVNFVPKGMIVEIIDLGVPRRKPVKAPRARRPSKSPVDAEATSEASVLHE